LDVPLYAIERAYEKDNVEVASGVNWNLNESRPTTPIKRAPEPVVFLAVLPEDSALIREDLLDEPDSAVVYFDTDKSLLTSSQKPKLTNLTKGFYKVYGYTDPRGSRKYNYKLSVSRAQAVAGYLEAEGHEVVELAGFGEDNRVSTDKAEYSLDRRVEIIQELK
jgi:outer membrane protein OmpA-like peptidoglycan-associated protein